MIVRQGLPVAVTQRKGWTFLCLKKNSFTSSNDKVVSFDVPSIRHLNNAMFVKKVGILTFMVVGA